MWSRNRERAMFTSMLAFLAGNDFILLTMSILIFELPRYTISLIIIGLSGITKYRPAPLKPTFTVSAIIPCFNDAEALKETADSLAPLRNEGLVEIIAVNDGSTDNSRQMAEQLKSEGKIDIIINHPRRQGRSPSVNHGARFARGELVVAVDSDSVVQPEAIIRMQDYFGAKRVWNIRNNTCQEL